MYTWLNEFAQTAHIASRDYELRVIIDLMPPGAGQKAAPERATH